MQVGILSWQLQRLPSFPVATRLPRSRVESLAVTPLSIIIIIIYNFIYTRRQPQLISTGAFAKERTKFTCKYE